jgi:hypothetical protein
MEFRGTATNFGSHFSPFTSVWKRNSTQNGNRDRWSFLRAVPCQARLLVVVAGLVLSMPGKQKVIRDEVRDPLAQVLTGRLIESEVLAGENPAQGCLLAGGRE